MPCGTSLSSDMTSSWKYRSLEYDLVWPRDCMAPSDPIPRYDLNCLPLMKMSSPGLSSQPASSEPSMTVSAPATIALAMSPEYCMPPSPMTGTTAWRQTSAASMIAETWGTPTPATTRVVQMDPGPTPTFTASAPASTIAWAPARVATLPPMTSTSGTSAFRRATMSSTLRLWPWAESTTRASTPASTRARARLYDSSPTPTAPATRSRPAGSFVEWGYCTLLAKSFTVISPTSRPDPSTMGSFST